MFVCTHRPISRSMSSSPDWKGTWNISHMLGMEPTASTTFRDMYRGWLCVAQRVEGMNDERSER